MQASVQASPAVSAAPTNSSSIVTFGPILTRPGVPLQVGALIVLHGAKPQIPLHAI